MISHGALTPTEALSFAMSLPGVSTTISGMDSMRVLDQNLEILRNFRPLSEESRFPRCVFMASSLTTGAMSSSRARSSTTAILAASGITSPRLLIYPHKVHFALCSGDETVSSDLPAASTRILRQASGLAVKRETYKEKAGIGCRPRFPHLCEIREVNLVAGREESVGCCDSPWPTASGGNRENPRPFPSSAPGNPRMFRAGAV